MMVDQKKFAFFIPNIFTGLNMACGFAAIMFSLKGDFYKASMFLVLGALFDSVDGRLARFLDAQSAFGEQFDSLSDLVSFGVAPSMIFYLRFLYESGRAGMVFAFFFMLCGALRLARFNANIDKVSSEFFQGLPTPGAAMALIGLTLFSTIWPTIVEWKTLAHVYILFYSLLMISTLPFPSFKKSNWVKEHRNHVLVIIFITLASMVVYEEFMILVLITVYVWASLFYFVSHRRQLGNIFDWKAESEK